jgi:membrane protease YdiL (CAAX protease family)
MQTLTHTVFILLLALVRCALLLPLFAVQWNVQVKKNFLYVLMFFAFVVLDQVVVQLLLDVIIFEGQRWNWLGKAAECLLALLFIATTLLTNREAGLDFRIKHSKQVFGFIVGLLSIIFAIYYFAFGFKNVSGTETFVFQLLMPGIAEELVFRGVLLGLLNKVYTKGFTVLQTPLGWGVVITSVLFGLVHSFNFGSYTIDFNMLYFVSTFSMGLFLAFVKEKSQSLLPGIACHNLFNLIVTYV